MARHGTVETQVATDQGLMRATACAIVDKLKSGEVTPLDLLDVLEQRIAEVDGQVNAMPTLCFDRARTHAKALMKKPAGERGLLAGNLQRGIRRDAQSLGYFAIRRRLLGRCRGGARDRHGVARPWLRHGRFAA